MDRFEAAARGAYICFRSAGGKLIIVKRLWVCHMEKALYKCTTLLYFQLLIGEIYGVQLITGAETTCIKYGLKAH